MTESPQSLGSLLNNLTAHAAKPRVERSAKIKPPADVSLGFDLLLAGFARQVKEYRAAEGHSIEHLAQLAGLSAHQVEDVEQGRDVLSLREYDQLMRALRVDPSLIYRKATDHRTTELSTRYERVGVANRRTFSRPKRAE